MITCDTKQIALGIGQCPSRKARVRGGSLGEGGSAEIFWFLVLPQEGMIEVWEWLAAVAIYCHHFFGSKFDQLYRKIMHQNDWMIIRN